MLEDIYVYFNRLDPGFGIQLVYNDTQCPELVTVVRGGDAVLMPNRFHPKVSVPGHRIVSSSRGRRPAVLRREPAALGSSDPMRAGKVGDL
jgi:hypothetical protein